MWAQLARHLSPSRMPYWPGLQQGLAIRTCFREHWGVNAAGSLHQDYKSFIDGAFYGAPTLRLFQNEDKHIRQVAAAAKIGHGMPTTTVVLLDPTGKNGHHRVLAKTFVALRKAIHASNRPECSLSGRRNRCFTAL